MGCIRLPLIGLICFSASAALAEVSIRVDGTQNSPDHRRLWGYHDVAGPRGPLGDTLTPELRRRAIEAAYGQVKLNGGNLNVNFVRATHAAAHGAEPSRAVSRLSHVRL